MNQITFNTLLLFFCLVYCVYASLLVFETRISSSITTMLLLAFIVVDVIIFNDIFSSTNQFLYFYIFMAFILFPLKVLFRNRFFHICMICLSSTLAQLIFVLLSFFIQTTFFPTTDVHSFYTIVSIMYFGFSAILLFIFYQFISERFKSMVEHIPYPYWSIYCIFPLMIILRLGYSFYNISFDPINHDWISFFIIIVIVVYVYFIIVDTMVQQTQKIEADHELERLNIISEVQKSYYQMLENKTRESAIFRHDLKHNIRLMNTLINENDIEGIKEILKNLDSHIEQNTITKYCMNKTLNGILSHYAEEAKNQNISLDIQVHIQEKCEIDDYDLCIVFGNAFENAIEACRKLDDKKEIQIKAEKIGDHLIIRFTNTFDGTINKEGDRLLTTKTKTPGGLGVDSIKSVVTKYHGDYSISYENNIFNLNIALNTLKEKA